MASHLLRFKEAGFVRETPTKLKSHMPRDGFDSDIFESGERQQALDHSAIGEGSI